MGDRFYQERKEFMERQKYGNSPRSGCAAGHQHRSKLESSVCDQYSLRIASGELSGVDCEVRVRICGPEGHDCRHTDKIDYIADFRCTREDGSVFFGEAKGYPTPLWALKLRLWRHYGPAELELWEGSHVRPVLKETVFPSWMKGASK